MEIHNQHIQIQNNSCLSYNYFIGKNSYTKGFNLELDFTLKFQLKINKENEEKYKGIE